MPFSFRVRIIERKNFSEFENIVESLKGFGYDRRTSQTNVEGKNDIPILAMPWKKNVSLGCSFEGKLRPPKLDMYQGEVHQELNKKHNHQFDHVLHAVILIE